MLTAAPDPVIALAERAIKAWDAHGAACEAFSPFEEAMFEWRDKNPQPAMPKSDEGAIGLDTAGAMGLSEDEQKLIRIWRRVPTAESEAVKKEHKAAMARWGRRERAAKRRSGFAKAESSANAACQASDEAMRALRDTPAHTHSPGLRPRRERRGTYLVRKIVL
jgi:hypothetical protein